VTPKPTPAAEASHGHGRDQKPAEHAGQHRERAGHGRSAGGPGRDQEGGEPDGDHGGRGPLGTVGQLPVRVPSVGERAEEEGEDESAGQQRLDQDHPSGVQRTGVQRQPQDCGCLPRQPGPVPQQPAHQPHRGEPTSARRGRGGGPVLDDGGGRERQCGRQREQDGGHPDRTR
jgi:hypothetical protein